MTIAEAIRKGSAMGPQIADIRHGAGFASCVLGAIENAYNSDIKGSDVSGVEGGYNFKGYSLAEDIFPEENERKVNIPIKGYEEKSLPFFYLIARLNNGNLSIDDLGYENITFPAWTREQIADWIEGGMKC